MNAWIKTEEKLPENINAFSNDRVLFVTKGIVRAGCYDYEFGDWIEESGGIYKEASHWMLLPEPPIEKSPGS